VRIQEARRAAGLGGARRGGAVGLSVVRVRARAGRTGRARRGGGHSRAEQEAAGVRGEERRHAGR